MFVRGLRLKPYNKSYNKRKNPFHYLTEIILGGGRLPICLYHLLAEPETLVQTARLNWVLRIPLPPSNPRSNRRFSSTPSYHYGPRTSHALDAAIRSAANFSHDDSPPTHSHTAAFVQLPDPATRFGDIRRPTTEPPSSPPPNVQRWLQSGAIRLHSQAEYQLWNQHCSSLSTP